MQSPIAQPNPLILRINELYVEKMFAWKKQTTTRVGKIFKVDQFKNHNWLVDINAIFSKQPAGWVVDRTRFVTSPLKFDIPRPWCIPKECYTLEQALQIRAQNLIETGHRLNLLWSGGIDSTAMVTAFLKHVPDTSQLKILYSPFSTYEHPAYLSFLKKYPKLELVDLSGMTYMTDEFDGIFITGDGGDELMGSLDETFFNTHGKTGIELPWLDLFYRTIPDDKFIEFCQSYFSQAGCPIDTVLQARWFFYAMCKTRFQLWRKLDLFSDYDNFVPNQLLGFFDCDEFEKYIYWNLESIIPGTQYSNWKLPLKQYCLNFDNLRDWYETKQKFNSDQVSIYANKKIIMHDRRLIFHLTDGQQISTPSLPLLSRIEYETSHGNTFDYLFNEPY